MNRPVNPTERSREVATVATAAIGLSGGEIDPYTRQLMDQICEGTISAVDAVAAVVSRFVSGLSGDAKWEPT